jgi:hypothetical protein
MLNPGTKNRICHRSLCDNVALQLKEFLTEMRHADHFWCCGYGKQSRGEEGWRAQFHREIDPAPTQR